METQKSIVSRRTENGLPQAKKSLGQNFLRDRNISRKIVQALNITHNDAVLEIGPGPGALTQFIVESAPARIVLVEKDNDLAFERKRALRQAYQGRHDVVLTDALTMPWHQFTAPWKIVGNLPYNVASPLMWDIMSQASGLQRAVFMVQKEVGQRLVAKPGSSAYGALSVWIQSFSTPKLEFIVPSHVFIPRPKIDSAVVSFVPIAAESRQFHPHKLSRIVKICFQMRRKQLGTILRFNGNNAELLNNIGIDPRVRPEELPPSTFHQLADLFFS